MIKFGLTSAAICMAIGVAALSGCATSQPAQQAAAPVYGTAPSYGPAPQGDNVYRSEVAPQRSAPIYEAQPPAPIYSAAPTYAPAAPAPARVATDRPSDIDNLCVIFAERPDWRAAAEAASAKWGASVPMILAMMRRESGLNGNAMARPGDMAGPYGYAQAIQSTWAWYQKSTGATGARRENFADAADFVGWYMQQTAKQNKVALNDAVGQYLAYNLGHGGFSRRGWEQKPGALAAAHKVEAFAQAYAQQAQGCIG